MELKAAIQAAIEGKAILFAGSGFSYGAKNWKDALLPTGIELRNLIAQECRIAHTDNDLSAVADYYLSLDGHSPNRLIGLIKDIFTLGTITDAHKSIMSIKWKRIYTTNYDSVIEEGAKNNGYIIQSVTMDDPVEIREDKITCVHINGSILELTEKTLQGSFKLTDRSYDADTLIGKDWYDFMDRDFSSAKAIIIIGFSMKNDIDIRRLIARPNISDKVVFISGPSSDPIDLNTLQKYAPVELIGVDGFAEKLLQEKKTFIPSTVMTVEFTSFIHEHMTPLNKCKTKLDDLTKFYYLGQIGLPILQKDQTGDYINLALRDAVNVFLSERTKHKVFLAVSNIGNGKTVLCELIRNELREIDIDVFTFNKETVDLRSEIEIICSSYRGKPIVVIIDDYYKYLNVLEAFRDFSDLSKITFVLTSRLSKLNANYRRLVNTLRISEDDIKPLHLNSLSENEMNLLGMVLENNRMLNDCLSGNSTISASAFIRDDCKASIANVIIKLFDSCYMKDQLISLFEIASQNEKVALKELTVASLASEVMNLRLSTSEIISMLDIDFVVLQLKESEIITELFDAEYNNILVKSPIIARKILYDVIPLNTLLSVLTKIVNAADKRYSNKPLYAEVMKAIISHANFAYWIKKPESIKLIKDFYDSLRFIPFFSKSNPFYWEQFASICIDAKDFLTAHQCLNNAFTEANTIPHFVPFQVETVYARYLIAKLKYELTNGDIIGENMMGIMLDAYNRLFKHYNHPEDEHYHVFQLLDNLISLFEDNINNFDRRDTSIFLEKMIKARKLLIKYQIEKESVFYPSTKKWVEDIDNAIGLGKEHLKELTK